MRMQIWDTAGQERFRCMVPMYMRDAAAAIIVFDITSRKSFDDVEKWIHELDRCSVEFNPILMIVGNKCDLADQRQVAHGEGLTKAYKYGAKYYEISAFDSNEINTMLFDLAKEFHNKKNVRIEQEKSLPILLCQQDGQQHSQRRRNCCSLG
ncbi:hypothetical protein AB6A40_006909 [Gnathostoma spinigerum]|uniref:Uncharacterized protein n=1 Tax=Gnathostoma spinigerum TaxID=75299 RepID=A0ABD6EKX1_9BILA